MSIRLNGLSKFRANLRQYEGQVGRIMTEEAERAGRFTEAEAKQSVPVDSGKARQSIYFEMPTRLVSSVSVNVPYAAILEFGTGGLVEIPEGWAAEAEAFRGNGTRQVNLPARPFLIPAAQRQYQAYQQQLKQRIAALRL